MKNVCTTFNLILFALGAIFILIEEPMNALATTGIITLNIIIATIQEMKAKRRLDRIALLLRPKVRIVRESGEFEADQNEIVKDDIIHLTSGDQALVDGELVSSYNLEMDESLLTGESSTVRKKTGDTVYSGSYCVTGEGHFRVTAFGDESYASQMLATARKFESKASPLQKETNTVTKVLMAIAFLYLGVFLLSSFLKGSDLSLSFLRNSTTWAAAILDIVPIALFLLVVIAYMVAALRMADSGVLLQQSNAVESMSHVDTVCMDKTGTITTNKLIFEELIPAGGDTEEAERYLRIFATATGSKNRTIEAVLNRYGTEDTELLEEILFSSERKYSAVRVKEGNGKTVTLYMGAPSVLKNYLTSGGKRLSDSVLENSRKGLRTVLLAKGTLSKLYEGEKPIVPSLKPVALITIRDEIRPDCRETIEVFLDNHMDLKVISGDDPETVNAMFTLANIPGERRIISGDEFDRLQGEEKVEAILGTNIFGRMKPDNKEEIVSVLKENGRYVAMVGDGVNDVKALKKANVGVALESGSSAARGVSDIVLMKDRFSALPKALVEGKRTVSGMRDILKLYLTRNFVLALIIPVFLVIGSVPFLPTSSAFYAFVSVSIVAFMMVIWAHPRDEKGPVLPGVLRFAIPSAIMLFIFAMITYSVFFVFSGPNFHYIDLDYASLGDEMFKSLTWDKDISDPMGATQEINARNAMLLFLTTAGVVQIFFIAPPVKFFSVDGRVTKDLRPLILTLLLLLLIFVVYGQENLLHMLSMVSLGNYRPLVYGLVLVWFFVARTVMRKGKLKLFTDMTERMLNKASELTGDAADKITGRNVSNDENGKAE